MNEKTLKGGKLSALALSVILALTACNADDGTDGIDGQNGVNGQDGANGQNGLDGQDGTNGQDGENGQDGANGLNSLTNTEVLQAGSDVCAQGGLAIHTGLDDNRDGILNDDEVDATQTLCGSEVLASADRNMSLPAMSHLQLAEGLHAEFLTREMGNHADQFDFYPAENPTHLIACIEGGDEVIDGASKMNPSVQRINLDDGTVETILRGMNRCDGIRTTPWGTILATEESSDGAAYEIMSPLSTTEITITERGAKGELGSIANADGSVATNVAKRIALPTMAWEGLEVLPSGVVIGGDELRPGSYDFKLDNNGSEVVYNKDTDGGAIFKFVPNSLGTTSITDLTQSPLVAGKTYAMQVSCVGGRQQFGQGCEVGNASWLEISTPANAREQANILGATGYYRPEDLHLDPTHTGDSIRFCWTNTGNKGAKHYGEVVCAIDSMPDAVDNTQRTLEVNRFVEGDMQFNAPDNLAFQPNTGIMYVIEDNQHGDVWACLPDGADTDNKTDGCVRVLSLNDTSAEPTGFIFSPDGREAYVSIQHSSDTDIELVDHYRTDDLVKITGFTEVTSTADNRSVLMKNQTEMLFGFDGVLTESATKTVDREALIAASGLDIAAGETGFAQDASDIIDLAPGLTATFLTRGASEWTDQFEFYPKVNPTHLVTCVEETRGLVDEGSAGKYKPSVQTINLNTGEVKTALRGMNRCDGIRVTDWGTVLATEESGDGAAYEILDVLGIENITVADRGAAGAPATIVDGINSTTDASDQVIKRTALPTMAWEGLEVLASGVVIGGDELRPGSYDQAYFADGSHNDDANGSEILANRDTDGGAIFKFIPDTIRTTSNAINNLSESPLASGTTYAMQVSCVSGKQQIGQGCEVGNAAWIEVNEQSARVDANVKGATGYYRPEDLHLDPTYKGEGVRFCWANTGNSGAANYGEVICGIDSAPEMADADARTVEVNRFVEGDTQLNAPDNLAFQPGTGILYVIEDRSNGDVWACLPDGADRDNKTDGCVRMLSIGSQSAEPTGFIFAPDGKTAYVSIQHAGGTVLYDGNDTDDMIMISGFDTELNNSLFGVEYENKLHTYSNALFGFGKPLMTSSTVGD